MSDGMTGEMVGGNGPPGPLAVSVDTLAALTAADAGSFPNGALAFVGGSLLSRYTFVKTSTLTTDPRLVLNATIDGAVTTGPTTPGRWHFDPSYVDPVNAAVTSWYVNQSTGHDDTGDGTSGNPLASVDEVFRRRGSSTSLPTLTINVVGPTYVGDIVIRLKAGTGTTTYLRFGQNQVATGTLSSITYPTRGSGSDATIIQCGTIASFAGYVGNQIVFAGGATAEIVGAPSANHARIELPSTYDTAGGTTSFGLTTYPSLVVGGTSAFTICSRTRHTGTLRLECDSQTSTGSLEAGVLVVQNASSDLLEPGNNIVSVATIYQALFIGPDVDCSATYLLGCSVVTDGLGVAEHIRPYIFAQATYFTSSVIVNGGMLHLDDDCILDGVTPSVDVGGRVKVEDTLCVINCDSPLSSGSGTIDMGGAVIYGNSNTTAIVRRNQLGQVLAHGATINATGAPAYLFDAAQSGVYPPDGASIPVTQVTGATALVAGQTRVEFDTTASSYPVTFPATSTITDGYHVTFVDVALKWGTHAAQWTGASGQKVQTPGTPATVSAAGGTVSFGTVGKVVTFEWHASVSTWFVVGIN